MGKHILVAHGGGPTAVINCSLQGVVENGRASGQVDKIYAARFGAEGILAGELIDLTDVSAGTIARLGHTPASAELALDASGLPIHVVVLELMGHNTGWVTAASAMAKRLTDCEVLTYLPEVLVGEDKMLADIERAYARGKGLLVTVSEGLRGLDGKPLADTGIVDGNQIADAFFDYALPLMGDGFPEYALLRK